MQHQSVINGKKTEDRKLWLYPILCPLCNLYQGKKIKTKFTQLRMHFNVVYQVHIAKEKRLPQMWTCDFSSPKYRGDMVYQTMHRLEKKNSKASRQKLVKWRIQNSNVRESPIARDTVLIIDAESGVSEG